MGSDIFPDPITFWTEFRTTLHNPRINHLLTSGVYYSENLKKRDGPYPGSLLRNLLQTPSQENFTENMKNTYFSSKAL